MISTDLNRAEFNGDASATVFVFRTGGTDIPVKDQSHIKVYVDAVLKTITTHYTVGFVGTTATITFTSGNVPPSGTANILFIRDVPFTQDTDLANNSQLDAESLESQLDLLVNQSQQINDKTSRNLRFSDTLTAANATETQATLNVTSALRANKAIKFDATGNLIVSSIDLDKAEDYVLESKSYATQTPAVVNHYSGGVASAQSGVYSSKEHAVGDATPSSKNYATKVNGAVTGTDFSAKAWSVGGTNVTTTSGRGSAKDWATKNDGVVDTAEFSAKAYASVTGSNAPTDGSAKEWATTEDAVVADSEYSSKEYAQGDVLAAGGSAKSWAQLATTPSTTATHASAKEWAIGTSTHKNDGSAKSWATITGAVVTGSEYSAKEYAIGTTVAVGSAKDWAVLAEDAVVDGGSGYSALHWAAKAEDSQLAAKNSAAAVANTFDAFDDTYLGAMKDPFVFTASSSSGLLLTHAAHGLLDGNIVQVASAGTLPTGLSASTNYYVVSKTTNNFKLATSSGGSAIAYTNAGSGSHTWVYGSPTTNGTWTKNSATITVVSNVGIRVGQKVSGTGIPTSPIPNVLSIDGTAVVISENMAAAGSGIATTFSSLGINGPYNTSTDGPSTDNDGEALASGNLFFNSTDNEMRIFDGATWIAATSAGSTSLLIYKYVATASQTTFTGADANGATLSYTAENINVFLNGVRLDASDYTASNGTSIVLGVGAAVSDELVVTAYKSFTTADMVSASAGGTFNNNVTFNGNITMSTTKKVQQKGAFMQSSTHQSWVLGG